MIPHAGLSGVTCTLSWCSSLVEWWGIVQPLQSSSYVGLPDPINSACGQYIIKCLFNGPLQMVLNGHRRGLPHWSIEYPHTTPHPSLPMILHFPLVVTPDLKFKPSIYFLPNFNHFNSIRGKKGSNIRVEPTTRLLPLATTKHSTTNSTIYYKKGSQG
jgi:hypothetical protein